MSDTNMTFINVQFELTIKVHVKFHAKLRQAGAHKQIIKSCISFYDPSFRPSFISLKFIGFQLFQSKSTL